ncbi:MAG: hypothetical protein EPN25_12515 [Nitrospirae bacterium]|nr:MAG: hypothetical protein EPN25_12515 [Nitrospirota bacterium]
MKKEDKDTLHVARLLFKAGRAQYCNGDYQKALESYRQIIKEGHRYADAFCGIGVCQRMLGNNEAAEAAAKEALEINSNHFGSLQLLAIIYTSQNNDALTYEYVSKALLNAPQSVAEMSPRLANFAKKIARYTYSGNPEDYVEEMLGLEEEDRIWLSWAREFKEEYESKTQNKSVHTDAE